MSFEAVLWALKDAPTADVNEYVVLIAYAEQARPDGRNGYLSQPTIAAQTHIDEQTVRRAVRRLVQRGLMRRGDQSVVAYIPKNYRPVNYDLLIPAAWYSNLERINTERAHEGLPPLTQENRPLLAPAPTRRARADAKPSNTQQSTAPAWVARRPPRGVSEPPRKPAQGYLQDTPGVSTRQGGGISETPPSDLQDTPEVSRSEVRGVLQTPNPVDPVILKEGPSPTPVVTAEVPRARTSGGGGEGFIGDRAIEGETDPLVIRAVALLVGLPYQLAVSADDRRDLAHELAPRLAVGWTAEQLHERLAAKLPTDGIIHPARFLAGRIRSLPDGPPPAPPAPGGPAQWSGPADHDRRLGLGDQEPVGTVSGGWRSMVEPWKDSWELSERQSPEVDA